MTARPPQRDGAGWFTTPAQVNHRRYEALRALFVDGLTYQQAADRFGYTRWAMVNLVREWRARGGGGVCPPPHPGPPAGPPPPAGRGSPWPGRGGPGGGSFLPPPASPARRRASRRPRTGHGA